MRLDSAYSLREEYSSRAPGGKCSVWAFIGPVQSITSKLHESKLPMPPALQAETGEVRPHLLKWLAKRRGIKPDESAPTLRFRDRAYIPEHDFIYLYSVEQIQAFSDSLASEKSTSMICDLFGGRVRRIALLASICHSEHLPLFPKRLDALPGLQELTFVFVELDRGELKFIGLVPKKNPAAYNLERLRDGDIKDYSRKLSRSIEGLEAFIRPMLGSHSKNLKIAACKMIPRCEGQGSAAWPRSSADYLRVVSDLIRSALRRGLAIGFSEDYLWQQIRQVDIGNGMACTLGSQKFFTCQVFCI